MPAPTAQNGIRWNTAQRIVWAWIFTIPAAAGMGAACLGVARALHGSW